MDFCEQVLYTVKKTAEAACDKSNQLIEIAKIKYAITTTRNELDKLYNTLGRLCYKASCGEEASETADAVIKNISEKREELRRLKDELEAAKNKNVCYEE